jgi:hypothetical protein
MERKRWIFRNKETLRVHKKNKGGYKNGII